MTNYEIRQGLEDMAARLRGEMPNIRHQEQRHQLSECLPDILRKPLDQSSPDAIPHPAK